MPRLNLPHNAGADHAIRFVSNLSLTGDRSGQPVILEKFQEHILRTLLSTDRQGKRKIRRACLYLPRKQSKTWLAATIVILWMLGLGKRSCQCLSVANDQKQAALLYDCAKQILENDPELRAMVEPVDSTKRITVPGRYSFYAALSTEAKTKTGYNPSLVVVDESQDISDPELIKNLTTGFAARDDYLLLFIGTAGTRKDVPFYAEVEYAKKVRDGVIVNPHYAPFIWEADAELPWDEPSTWKRAMPAYGTFCNAEFIQAEADLATHLPAKQAEFEQYYLNRWQMGSATKWLPDADWMACSSSPMGDARFYTLGVDVASVSDTSSAVLFGQNSAGLYDVIPTCWVAEAQVAQRKTADFDYRTWAKAGLLTVTRGEVQDQEKIFADLLAICERYPVRQIALDRWGTQWLGQKILDAGLPVVYYGQGYESQSPALKNIERLTLSKQLAHGGHPIARWMMSNVAIERNHTDGIRLNKVKSSEKVDIISALASAVGVYPFNGEQSGRSIYEDRGILTLSAK